ncbi:MAG: hypothetical protein NVS1B1_11370 [Candidatus Limnocylindrales bacterium]
MVAGTRAIEGVTRVEASALERRLVIRYDPARTDRSTIALAVDRIVEGLAQ